MRNIGIPIQYGSEHIGNSEELDKETCIPHVGGQMF